MHSTGSSQNTLTALLCTFTNCPQGQEPPGQQPPSCKHPNQTIHQYPCGEIPCHHTVIIHCREIAGRASTCKSSRNTPKLLGPPRLMGRSMDVIRHSQRPINIHGHFLAGNRTALRYSNMGHRRLVQQEKSKRSMRGRMDHSMHPNKTALNRNVLGAQPISEFLQGRDAWPMCHAHSSSGLTRVLPPTLLVHHSMLQQQESTRHVTFPSLQDQTKHQMRRHT
jgi:hypothetical protein